MSDLAGFIPLLILIAIIVWLVRSKSLFRKPPLKICTECFDVGFGTNHTKGSIAIEIVLWLMLIVPGLIYSIWRLSTRKLVCQKCGGALIPTETPRGKQLFKQYHMSD